MNFSFDSQSEAKQTRLKKLTLAGFALLALLAFTSWTFYTPEVTKLSIPQRPVSQEPLESIMSKVSLALSALPLFGSTNLDLTFLLPLLGYLGK